MIISHKHKFVFLHVHRTGGTSIARALLPYLGEKDEVYGYTHEREVESDKNRSKNLSGGSGKKHEQGALPWKHSTAKWAKRYLGAKKWNQYFKFSVVRNPFDIYLSLYFWWKKTEGKWDPEPEGYTAMYKKIKRMTFDQYVSSECSWEYTLSDYLSSEDKKFQKIDAEGGLDREIEIDFVGRFDSLRLDFSYLCGRIGLPNLPLYRENESRALEKRNHVSSFLKTESARSVVRKKHDLDLDYFGYGIDYNEYAESWEKYMM